MNEDKEVRVSNSTNPNWIVAIATAALVVVTSAYVIVNYGILKTMEKTLDSQLKFYEVSLIPFVSIELDSIPPRPDAKFIVYYTISNPSSHPAQRLRVVMGLTDNKDKPLPYERFNPNEVYSALYPGQKYHGSKELNDPKIPSWVLAGAAYWKIRVNYDDILNNHWDLKITSFVKFYNQELKAGKIEYQLIGGVQAVDLAKIKEDGTPLEITLKSKAYE